MRLTFDDSDRGKKPLTGDDLVRFIEACRQLGMPLDQVTLNGKTKIGLGSGPLKVLTAEWKHEPIEQPTCPSEQPTRPNIPITQTTQQ